MFKKVLATLALLSSVLFGSLTDIPDIQDPEFSWNGLGLEDVYPDRTPKSARPHIDFFGIKHRSYTTRNNFAEIPDNLIAEDGSLTEVSTVLRSELFYEACLMFKIFYINDIYSNITPATSEAFKRLYWNRINLFRVLIIKIFTAVDTYIESHPPLPEAFQFKELLSSQLTNLTDFYHECINDPAPFEFLSKDFQDRYNARRNLNNRLCTIFSIPIPEESAEESSEVVQHMPAQMVLSRSKL